MIRIAWLLVLIAIIALGLASRLFGTHLPTFIVRFAGDTLYACAMFALIALLFPQWKIARIAVIAIGACAVVELSQLYHSPWIDTIRATHIGGWILGFGFLWSDLACYVVGIAMMAALTRLVSPGSISSRHHMKKEI